jgi:hypothetical protein
VLEIEVGKRKRKWCWSAVHGVGSRPPKPGENRVIAGFLEEYHKDHRTCDERANAAGSACDPSFP